MALKQVDLVTDAVDLSLNAERLVRDAEARIERFLHDRRDDPLPAFVPSDFRLSYAALQRVLDRRLAPDHTFCEWGSGFGVTACLASELGFEACGIEIERDLVDEARQLAEDHDLAVEFAHGSFIPDSGEHLVVDTGDFASLSLGMHTGYEELGLDVDDFGLIYAYPWPGEESTVERLFDAYAAVGALLVTYRGMNDIHIHRKVRR